MKETAKQRQVKAYHEAGHAVAALNLECKIDTVTIVSGDGYDGRLVYRSLLARLNNIQWETDRDKIRRNYGRVEDTIIVALAGPFAQRRHNPDSHWRVAGMGKGPLLVRGTDFDTASELIFRFYGNGEVAAAYWRYVEARTKSLVDGRWAEVEAVAQRLLEQGTISEEEVREAAYARLLLHSLPAPIVSCVDTASL